MPEPAAEVGLVLAVQLVAELAAGQLAAAEAVDLSAAGPSAVQPKPRKSKCELHSLQNMEQSGCICKTTKDKILLFLAMCYIHVCRDSKTDLSSQLTP